MGTVHDYYAFIRFNICCVSSANHGDDLRFCPNPYPVYPVQAFQAHSVVKLPRSSDFAFLSAADVSTTRLSKRNPF